MIVALLPLSIPVFASDTTATSFQLGIKAYQRGDYYLALEYFNDAIPDEANLPALYYNIGVAHYRLGEYEQADEAFTRVALTPQWESLALYNRALIAFRQDQPDLAKEYATRSLALSTSTGLKNLNQRLLDRLKPVESNGTDKRGWSKRASFGWGYNDNVTLSESDAFNISGKPDSFLDFNARLQRHLTFRDSNKLKATLEVGVRDYTAVNEFDQGSIGAGIEKMLDHDRGRLGAHLAQVYLDGASYQLITSLDYRRSFEVGSQPLQFNYLFSNYESTDSSSSYLGGVRHRFLLSRDRELEKGVLKLYWRLDYNDREDLQSGSDFYSYSPLRNGLGIAYTRNLESKWAFTGLAYYQASRFLDPDSRSGLDKIREDDYLALRLRMSRGINSSTDYRLNYTHAVNHSNYPEFEYAQNIVSIEFLKYF